MEASRETIKPSVRIEPQTVPKHSVAAPPPEGYTAAQLQKNIVSLEPPTNTQLIGALQHAEQLLENRKREAQHPETIRVAEDAQQVLRSAQLMIQERNKGQELQQIMLHTKEGAAAAMAQHGGQQGLLQRAKETLTGGQEKLRTTDPRARLQSARNFVMLLVRSPEFRDSLLELVHLLQRLIEMGPPKGGILGRRRGVSVGGAGEQVTVETVVNVPGALPSVTTTTVPAGTTATVQAAGLPGAVPSTLPPASSMGAPHARFIPAGTSVPVTTPTTTAVGTATTEGIAREIRQKIRNILKIWANNPQYRDGVENLIRVLRQARDVWYQRRATLESQSKSVYSNEHVKASLAQAKALIAEFTGGRPIDILINNFRTTADLIWKDPVLREYLEELRVYIKEGLRNPEVFDDDERMRYFTRKGRNLFREIRAHPSTRATFDEARIILTAIRNDPVAVRFAEDLRRLMNDLFVNENGRPVMKLEAARALKDIIIGMFMDELKYFPIPNISGRDANMEWAISDINMTLFDLLPEDISIEQAAGTHFLPKTIGSAAPSTVGSKGYFVVKIHKHRTRIDNIHYYIKRYKAPRIEDSGIAAVDILRNGIKIKLYMEAHYGTKYTHYFRLRDVRVRVDKMKLYVQGSRYGWLIKLFKPIINSVMRRRTEMAIQDAIWKNVGQLESRVHRAIENLTLRSNRPELGEKLAALEKFVPVVAPGKPGTVPPPQPVAAQAGVTAATGPKIA